MITFRPSELPRLSIDRACIRSVGRTIGKRLPFLNGTVGLHFIGPKEMKRLNRDFRHQDRPTNVLSFPSADHADVVARFPQLHPIFGSRPTHKPQSNATAPWLKGEMEWGEIFLCRSVIRKEAAELEETPCDRQARLLLHGCLHLFGFRHDAEKPAKRMERLERQLWKEKC